MQEKGKELPIYSRPSDGFGRAKVAHNQWRFCPENMKVKYFQNRPSNILYYVPTQLGPEIFENIACLPLFHWYDFSI